MIKNVSQNPFRLFFDMDVDLETVFPTVVRLSNLPAHKMTNISINSFRPVGDTSQDIFTNTYAFGKGILFDRITFIAGESAGCYAQFTATRQTEEVGNHLVQATVTCGIADSTNTNHHNGVTGIGFDLKEQLTEEEEAAILVEIVTQGTRPTT